METGDQNKNNKPLKKLAAKVAGFFRARADVEAPLSPSQNADIDRPAPETTISSDSIPQDQSSQDIAPATQHLDNIGSGTPIP